MSNSYSLFGSIPMNDATTTRETMARTAEWSQLEWQKDNRSRVIGARFMAFVAVGSALKDIPLYILQGCTAPIAQLCKGRPLKAICTLGNSLAGAARSTALAISLAVASILGLFLGAMVLKHFAPLGDERPTRTALQDELNEARREKATLEETRNELNRQLTEAIAGRDAVANQLAPITEERDRLTRTVAAQENFQNRMLQAERQLLAKDQELLVLRQQLRRKGVTSETLSVLQGQMQPLNSVDDSIKLGQIVLEMMTTEEDYLAKLAITKSMLRAAMQETPENKKLPLTPYEKASIEESIEAVDALSKVGSALVADLRRIPTPPSSEQIITVLGKHRDYFETYPKITPTYQKFLTIVYGSENMLKRVDQAAANQAEAQTNHDKTSALLNNFRAVRFQDWWITIAQRPVKYDLFIQDIARASSTSCYWLYTEVKSINVETNKRVGLYTDGQKGADLARTAYERYLVDGSEKNIREFVAEQPSIDFAAILKMSDQIPAIERLGAGGAALEAFIETARHAVSMPNIAAVQDDNGIKQTEALLLYWTAKKGHLHRLRSNEKVEFQDAIAKCPQITLEALAAAKCPHASPEQVNNFKTFVRQTIETRRGQTGSN